LQCREMGIEMCTKGGQKLTAINDEGRNASGAWADGLKAGA
jgi:hypothetical protein